MAETQTQLFEDLIRNIADQMHVDPTIQRLTHKLALIEAPTMMQCDRELIQSKNSLRLGSVDPCGNGTVRIWIHHQ